MREPAGTSLGAAAPMLGPVALVLGYVATVVAFHRARDFDLPFHIIVLILMGVMFGAPSPFREIATAMLATLLMASVFAHLLGLSGRRAKDIPRHRIETRTATLGRPPGQPTPRDAR